MSKSQTPQPQSNRDAPLDTQTPQPAPPFTPAFLRTRDVPRITSLSRATLYRRASARRFPAPVHLGGRACGWPVAAIHDLTRDPEGFCAPAAEVEIARARRLPLKVRRFPSAMSMKQEEWDTLLFFYGVMMSVAGLSALAYCTAFSPLSYEALGPSTTNVILGGVSAIIDNIPIRFAVLRIPPDMTRSQ